MAVIDLDHFKRVNDVFGHAVGDRVLVQMADLLTERHATDDLVTRTGGENLCWSCRIWDRPTPLTSASGCGCAYPIQLGHDRP